MERCRDSIAKSHETMTVGMAAHMYWQIRIYKDYTSNPSLHLSFGILLQEYYAIKLALCSKKGC